jgi:hypothetical protein
MSNQSTDNFIANYETAQRQNHARFLREIKAEFYLYRAALDHIRRASYSTGDTMGHQPQSDRSRPTRP